MELTHFNEDGGVRMVDVSAKEDSRREAVAEGRVLMLPATLALVKQGLVGKGDVLGIALVAGIMGAKNAWQWIPLCHPLLLTGVDVALALDEMANCIHITASVKTTGKTGVEMEALTAVAAAALTIYDMCKAADKDMVVEYIRLIAKSGGRSGNYRRNGKD